MSFSVQTLLSEQVAALLVYVHPVSALQSSSVQTLPSLQLRALPGWQEPPSHWSLMVHRLASSQGAVLLLCWQPISGLQVSVVQ
jgi:hypothetical protein